MKMQEEMRTGEDILNRIDSEYNEAKFKLSQSAVAYEVIDYRLNEIRRQREILEKQIPKPL